ncbi:AAA family ATPase [soil metagenome]
MIVFINGPFGVGKTTLANVLVEKLPNAMIFDPEEVGYLLRRLLGPLANVEDFQDLTLWRSLAVEVARQVYEEYRKDLVMPMSIFRRDYFDQITNGLRGFEPQFIAVRLVASRESLVKRIDISDEVGARDWRMKHIDAFASETLGSSLGIPIQTDSRTPNDIADNILGLFE